MSKISKSMKKNLKSDSLSNFSKNESNKIKILNNDLFKDISEIKPKENFYCDQDIKNSIFKEKPLDGEYKEISALNLSNLNSNITEQVLSNELSEMYFQVISL